VSGDGRLAAAAPEVASILASILDDPLVVMDVGCRWGFADTWEQLGDRCSAVGFEPDAEECERLRHHYADRPWVQIVAEALGAAPGPATLHVTREPGSSSLYPPLDDVIDRHPRLEMQREVQAQRIELTTLDDWCARSGFTRADLVKLDTQGSELDILRGAQRMLETVDVVQTEVEFNPMYDGQPLFGDVDRFLRDRGFVLWHLENLAHHRQHGARITLSPAHHLYDFDEVRFTHRSGQLFWADAVFVRADMTRPNATGDWPTALRRACLAISLGLTDLAGLALDAHVRALRGEERDVVERVRRLLPPHDVEIERQTDLVGRDPRWAEPFIPQHEGVLARDLVLPLEEPLEGAGWQEPHRYWGEPVRFTGPGRHAWIDLPLQLPPACRIELVVVADAEHRGRELTMTVNDHPIALEWAPEGPGAVGVGCIPPDYRSGSAFTRIKVTTPDPLIRPGLDLRKIGVAVTELRLIPLPGPAK
jgi:FkbM family methyltransferase